MTGRQATLAHEAAHVVGGLLAGHRIGRVELGPTTRNPRDAGTTTFDFAGSPAVDMFGHLVAVLMGPLAAVEEVPTWPLQLDPDSSDSLAIAALVNHLHLSKGDYLAAVALASHHLDDPLTKGAIGRVAHALGKKGSLTHQEVRDALGPGLVEWLGLPFREAAA